TFSNHGALSQITGSNGSMLAAGALCIVFAGNNDVSSILFFGIHGAIVEVLIYHIKGKLADLWNITSEWQYSAPARRISSVEISSPILRSTGTSKSPNSSKSGIVEILGPFLISPRSSFGTGSVSISVLTIGSLRSSNFG